MFKGLQRLITILQSFLIDILLWAAWAVDESLWTLLHWLVLTIELCLWKALQRLVASLWNGSAVQCLRFFYHLSPLAWILLPEIIFGAFSFTCMGIQRMIQVGLFIGWLVFLSIISVWFKLLMSWLTSIFLLWLIFPWKVISGSITYIKHLLVQS